ncbi:hypothetical protein B7992_12155, partial [Fibrobacter sp. UWH1]
KKFLGPSLSTSPIPSIFSRASRVLASVRFSVSAVSFGGEANYRIFWMNVKGVSAKKFTFFAIFQR